MKILLVDDEREEREGISYLIRKFQYPLEIEQAGSAKEALDILEEETIDILFTDVKMPVMSGLELARKVRENNKEIKIIIFSAYAEFEYAKQAIEMNALRYLLKPIEIEEFKSLMDDLLLSLEQEQRTSKRDVLFKIFTGVKLEKGYDELTKKSSFLDSDAGYRFLNIEFANNYFEEQEEEFLQIVKRYLGDDVEYVALYPNESCLLLLDPDMNKNKKLMEQVRKLTGAIQRCTDDEWILFVSPLAHDLSELEKYSKQVDNTKSVIWGYGNRIIEMNEQYEKTEHYVPDIESAWNQVLSSLDSKNPDVIREKSSQLVQSILVDQADQKVSRLYVQNLLYTVIKSMYDKLPGIESEEVLIAAESLFKARDAKTILEEYEKIVDKMTDSIRLDNNEKDIILRIKGMIEREYMNDISLNDVAEQIHLAPAYVSYIFKKETGQPLIKYITDVKMAKACKFLEEKNMKIVQVGRACGYENQSYFNRLFKNYYGLTPKQYREQL